MGLAQKALFTCAPHRLKAAVCLGFASRLLHGSTITNVITAARCDRSPYMGKRELVPGNDNHQKSNKLGKL